MKSNMHRRLLRLVATEVFLQLGFERATEQSLNIGADLISYYLEALVKRMAPLQDAEPYTIINMVVGDFYADGEYEKEEMLQFLEQQVLIRRQSKERVEGDPLQLHVLKAQPQEMSFRNALQNINTLAVGEKSRPKATEEVAIDSTMTAFIEKCNAETAARSVAEFNFDTTKILEEICEDAQSKDEGPFCSQFDISAIQEFALEDFSGRERYRVYKP